MAQTVVKQMIEPGLDKSFLADSYGYRPDKSALEAVGVTRERCWKYDWVLEFDIKGLFDNIDHSLLMRAVRKHVTCPWALLYIERWLTVPMLREDGTLIGRTRGTPQGGVVTPRTKSISLHHTSSSSQFLISRKSNIHIHIRDRPKRRRRNGSMRPMGYSRMGRA